MAKRQTAKTAKTATAIRVRDNGKPESIVPTLTTIDAIIAFVIAHVNADNASAMITLFRDTFGRTVHNRNVGRTTGWRIMEFQNRIAERLTGRATLVQLVVIGAAEFPNAVGRIFAPRNPASGMINVADAVSTWATTLTLINDGRHANMKPANPYVFDRGIDGGRKRTTQPATVPATVPAAVVTSKRGTRLVRKSA